MMHRCVRDLLDCCSKRADYTPDRNGNKTLIILACLNLGVFYPGTKLYYIWRNKQKRAKWEALSHQVSA